MRSWMVLAPVIVLAACGPAAEPSPLGSIAPYTQSADLCGKLPDDVPELPARQSTDPVPEGFSVSWVLDCAEGIPTPSGEPQKSVRRAEGAAVDLVTALRLPSATERSAACTAEYLLPFYLALITADGRVIAPAIPVDGCAKPRREVLAALGRLPFH